MDWLISLVLWMQIIIMLLVVANKHQELRCSLILVQLFFVLVIYIYIFAHRFLPYPYVDIYTYNMTLIILMVTHGVNICTLLFYFKIFKIKYDTYEIYTSLLIFISTSLLCIYISDLHDNFLLSKIFGFSMIMLVMYV